MTTRQWPENPGAANLESDGSIMAVAELAREGVQLFKTGDGREVVVAPVGHRVTTVSGREDLPEPPTRIKAHQTFHVVESFGRYCLRFKDESALLIADIDDNKVVCALDYHHPNDSEEAALKARAVDHIAVLELPYSDEFKAWDAMEGPDLNTQDELLEFLTQHAVDLVTPDQATMLELVGDFAVESTTAFVSRKQLKSGEVELKYETKDNIKGTIIVPDKLKVSLPIFRGEEAVELDAWFRYRVVGGKLMMGFVWHRFHEVKQAAFQQAVTKAAEEAGLAPFYGSVSGLK